MAQNIKRDKLVLTALTMQTAGKSPEKVLPKLDQRTADLLVELAKQLKAQGMSGPEHRAPERLKALQALLEKYLPRNREMGNLQFLATLHPLLRQQVLAQESLLMKEENARRVLLTKQMLARARSPQAGISLV